MSVCRCHPGVRGLHNSFLTLTYSPQQLPKDLSLDVTHWQKFAKRLRKAKGPFRFFHVGEYGDVHLRPHYHALVFGIDFHEDRKVFKRKADGVNLYSSPTLDKLWGLGHASIGVVNSTTAAYVAHYCTKKLRGELGLEQTRRFNPSTGEEWYVRPEYCTMSRRPNGLGAGWLERFRSDVYPSDEIVEDGRRHPVPRYYDSLLERWDPGAFADTKAKRSRAMAALRASTSSSEIEKGLRAREEIARSRLSVVTPRRDVG